MIFFFQAEDGIRDLTVTGVQTCALPISSTSVQTANRRERHPLGAPSESGELANAAASRGPASWARCQRRAASAGVGPRSTFTCTAAVELIIVRPAAHWASKYASIAA